MSIWYPQSDDLAGYYDDEHADAAEVLADLREEEADDLAADLHWSDPNSGMLCGGCGYLHSACVCNEPCDGPEGEDGYASGGHMEYWHAQYDG